MIHCLCFLCLELIASSFFVLNSAAIPVLRLNRGKRRLLASGEEDDDASKDDDDVVVMETSICEVPIPKTPSTVKLFKDKEASMPKTGTDADEEAEVGSRCSLIWWLTFQCLLFTGPLTLVCPFLGYGS